MLPNAVDCCDKKEALKLYSKPDCYGTLWQDRLWLVPNILRFVPIPRTHKRLAKKGVNS